MIDKQNSIDKFKLLRDFIILRIFISFSKESGKLDWAVARTFNSLGKRIDVLESNIFGLFFTKLVKDGAKTFKEIFEFKEFVNKIGISFNNEKKFSEIYFLVAVLLNQIQEYEKLFQSIAFLLLESI